MCSRIVLGLISFILTFLVSTVDSDLAEPLNDESLFSDQPLPLDESALSSNQPVFLASNDIASQSSNQPVFLASNDIAPPSFSDWDDLNTDTSELLSSSESANDSILSTPFNDPLLADTSQQVGCLTSSEYLPPFGKSRARRRDGLGLCPNTANGGAGDIVWPDLPGLRELRTKWDGQELMNEAVGDSRFNALCYLYSLSILPFGVCSSGDPKDVRLTTGETAIGPYGRFITYIVSRGTLGTLINV